MRHDFHLQGQAFRLRPIGDADAELVLSLRGNPELNRYLHRSSSRIEDQLAWFADYYDRPGDYYFVLERFDGQPEGVVSIYDVANGAAEWGRWILKPGSLAAVECAWLIYRIAFEVLGLDVIYCRTLAENERVVSFHDSCGITERSLLPAYVTLEGVAMDAIEHRLTSYQWSDIAPRLEYLAKQMARRALRG